VISVQAIVHPLESLQIRRNHNRLKSLSFFFILSLNVPSTEKDLLPTVSDPVPDAWVKTFFHGDTLDTVALFSEAVDSIRGMSANSDRCHLTLRALLAMPSSGGNMVVEKDF